MVQTTCDPGLAGEDLAIEAAWDAVVEEFGAVDRALSGFHADSESSRCQADDDWDGASWRLRTALVLCDRAHRATGGRFDPRVLTALQRHGFGPPDSPLRPAPARLAFPGRPTPADPPADGPRSTSVLERGGRSLRPTDRIDLGGIGKGLALRWAARAAAGYLARRGFLIDAGGDIATGAARPADPTQPGRWSIAIEDPLGGAMPVATFALSPGMAVATSSIRVWHRERANGVPVHHLIDPRTGLPGGDGLAAVTVAWPDPAWAEVWSKSLFLAGASGIAEEARKRGLAAWWVGTDGLLAMTPAARVATTWVRDEASAWRRVSPRGAVDPNRSATHGQATDRWARGRSIPARG
ncbi:MAG TPA: FAD:protein FMN transferase [Candidatus Limnocylindrales bacterium]|nr:FAD:protein FMN transferase [Candidatus Limnocylindrales bacterium]